MSTIGIDIGYGFTKVYMMNDGIEKRVLFPTTVSRYAPEFSFTAKIPFVRVNTERFFVGQGIIDNAISPEPTVRDDFVGSPSYMAVLGYALSQMGYPKILVLGLPPLFFNKERVKELIERLKEQWIVDSKEQPIPIPETVKIVPQGAGIFFSYVSYYPEVFYKNVMIMDLGYHTLDFVFFLKGKYIEGSVTSLPFGVKKVYDEIRKLFSSTYGTFSKDDESIEKIIKNGKYVHLGKEYHLDVTEILSSYRNLVHGSIKSHVREIAKDLDLVLAGGGGISLFQDTLNFITPVNDPQFANAIGYYEYGKQFLVS